MSPTIAAFCKANYGVSFPMFAKTTVTGDGANRLFRRLTAAAGAPEWNFQQVPRGPLRAGRRALRRGNRTGRRPAEGEAPKAAVVSAFEVESDLALTVLAERHIARLPGPRRGSGAVKRARL